MLFSIFENPVFFRVNGGGDDNAGTCARARANTPTTYTT